MARISLLFTLALVLAIGSVLAHPPSHKRFEKPMCLSQLQSYSFDTISKVVHKKAQASVHETAQFKILFNVCKGYTEYLGTFQKFKGAKNVVALVHAKYAVMSHAMLAAQATVGVEGSLSVKLSKSYSGMAHGFVALSEKIALISAKYKFAANAKISQSDLMDIDRCLINLKGSIRVFFNVIAEVSKKSSASGGIDFRGRIGSGFLGSFVKQGLGFGARAGANVGAILGAHASELGAGAGAGGKIGADAGAQAGFNVGGKIGAQAGAEVGAHAGAKAGGQAGRLLRQITIPYPGYPGRSPRFDEDEGRKERVGGGRVIRPLSPSNTKH